LDSKQEIELFNKIKAGDKQSFKLLFNNYYSRLCSYTEKITGRDDIAEEIAQGVFIKIWENRYNINIQKNVKGYLFRSVHNHALKYIQAQKIEAKYIEYNEIFGTGHTTEISDFELSEIINKSINELPEKCREVFLMSRIDQLKHKEIANKLGISEKTVEVQIRNANLKLREKLKEFKINN